MRVSKRFAAACAAILLTASAAQTTGAQKGTFGIAIGGGPYLSGSRIPLQLTGVPGRSSFAVSGPGSVTGSVFEAPYVTQSTQTGIIGAAQGALAYRDVRIEPAPQAGRALIAVASYDNGVTLHDPQTFAILGYLAIGGPPGDVAFTARGDILAPDTDGNILAWATRSPWHVKYIEGVALGNEVAADERTGNAFVSNRDVNGAGALTRVTPAGTVTRVVTGITAEGLAVDPERSVVYVGNVNDRTVAAIDASTMNVRHKVPSVLRTFGIALDAKKQILYTVANISSDMHSGNGFVEAIDVRTGKAIARSGPMVFPLGAALDAQRDRLFVTDESSDEVYVLDARTLRTVHAPLLTCHTPWRPRIFHERLYVPCTRSDNVDVVDTRTLRRVARAPFATGGFPLSVAVWP
ncbi:MAG TPA: hypothetical protein VFL13_10945 [Candidatus Baltobacteraceae bacterium]|nr:hypothetical protein [Candidatus Baltobacteraceae bacterium]